MTEVARLHVSIIKTKNFVLRCPRPRPRGLHSPRSATLHFVQQTRSAQRNSFFRVDKHFFYF